MKVVEEQIAEGFKMTELGLLPEEWEIESLENIAKISSGGSAPQGNEYFSGNNPFIRVQHIDLDSDRITKWDLITDEAVKKYKLKLYPKDTIVFPKSGASIYLEKRAMLPVDAYIVSHLCAINATNPKINQKYLFFVSRHKRFSKEKADGYPTLNLSEVKLFNIPLPPLPEQQKIASVLSAVQEAREKTENVIKATKELKKSMMKHLFTYGTVPVEEAEKISLKETEIGLLPEEWEVKKLGDIEDENYINFQNGFPCGKWNDKGIGIPQLRPFNITEEGEIDISNLKYIETDKKIESYLLNYFDVIFNNTNSEELVGKTTLWTKDGSFVLSNHMTRIRILDEKILNSKFLALLLHKKWFDGYYQSICRRHVNQASISLERLRQILIPLPPLPEQHQIAEILTTIDEKIEVEENKKKALDALFKSLLSQLMTGKIRVNNLEI